ncbi:MAG: DUF5069 domain-containing protein [Chloroflexota bacterium]|nr:DUF5069 domain-containing protein [Chloroflexota bacterium]
MDLSKEYPRSASERFAGVAMAPRTTDKCRAHLAGTLGEYVYNCGLDRKLFEFLGTDKDEFAAAVTAAGTDADVEAFVRQKVTGRPAEEIAAWNRRFFDYEPDLSRDAYAGQREALARRAPGRTDLTLWVHLTDMEEGRPVPTAAEVEAFKAQLLQPA